MIRILLLAALLASTVPARAAATAPEDVEWSAFDHVLTLVETVVRAGMQPNPDAAMAEVLSGHNPRVNGALAGLFAGAPPSCRPSTAIAWPRSAPRLPAMPRLTRRRPPLPP